MAVVGQVLATLLWLYWLILIGRLIFDFVQIFARSWQPRGPILVIAEAIYSVTDPPLRFLRRFIPPLKLGGVQFDLAFLILIIAVQILINVALAL
ncbi:MAG: YggT family protein [Candidatus Nanopelagicales bacterium]|nr:YggT family protein [Candidatus Nanopelagicales bacterium]MDP4716031.1 YggT family protein [Candidatus Nanopelagicales bacterium]MDP4906127.1 YggT family protein [Candidatus Nanopelagicales bacterium]MDP4975739.1 YggT family protein [Candidatus Nanopelagicales bacterium]MDP5094588.1 YggT family protein [Candidatus Nanopelagicales bacterium]